MKKNKLNNNLKSVINGLFSLVATLFSAPVGVVVFVNVPNRYFIRR